MNYTEAPPDNVLQLQYYSGHLFAVGVPAEDIRARFYSSLDLATAHSVTRQYMLEYNVNVDLRQVDLKFKLTKATCETVWICHIEARSRSDRRDQSPRGQPTGSNTPCADGNVSEHGVGSRSARRPWFAVL